MPTQKWASATNEVNSLLGVTADVALRENLRLG